MSTASMKAVVVTEYGGPDVLRLAEVPRPEAGPGRLRIRVHAATVNPADTVLRAGELARVLGAGRLRPPHIPGMEAAGVVDQIGPGARTDLRVGDRVMAIVSPVESTGGAYAEFLVVAPDQVTRAPVGTTHAEAATLPMNGLTARLALDQLDLGEGETIAVTGAAGAVGGYAVQLAKADGLYVIADAAERDQELVEKLGADVVVTRGPDVGRHIRQFWPEGVAAVIDGSLQGPDVVAAIRDGGQLASLRAWLLDGVPGLGEDRGVKVRRVHVGEYIHAHDRLDGLRRRVEEGTLTPRVARTHPASQAAQAHRDLEAGGVRGRLVLIFD